MEDLDERLEEFSRLCMLGNFAVAKRFARDSLAGQLHLPYFRVRLAEMFIRQGDYSSMVDLGSITPSRELADADEQLLEEYLSLMTHLAESFKLNAAQYANHGIIMRSLDGLSMRSQSNELGSTEVSRWFLMAVQGYIPYY